MVEWIQNLNILRRNSYLRKSRKKLLGNESWNHKCRKKFVKLKVEPSLQFCMIPRYPSVIEPIFENYAPCNSREQLTKCISVKWKLPKFNFSRKTSTIESFSNEVTASNLRNSIKNFWIMSPVFAQVLLSVLQNGIALLVLCWESSDIFRICYIQRNI